MAKLNQRLKELRASARPPISLGEMAQALGLESRQAYHFYERENGFKQRFLPVALARGIASVLAERHVNPDDVLALAGIGENEAALNLSAGEERLVGRFRALDAGQRRLLLELADAMGNAATAPVQDRSTVHAPGQPVFRAAAE